MRTTKRELQESLARACWFAGLPRQAISPAQVRNLQEEHGFVPACQYAAGMFVERGEIGLLDNVRFKYRTRAGER